MSNKKIYILSLNERIGYLMKENKDYKWELDDKTQNIYDNLCSQIERVFKHCNQGSIDNTDIRRI